MKKETELRPLLVSAKQIKQMLCIGEGTIQRLVRRKDFPPPLNIGISRNLWRLSDIESWVKNCGLKRTWGKMTEVEWHPIQAVKTEDGTIKWEGNTPTPLVKVLVTESDGDVRTDIFIQDLNEDYFDTCLSDVIAWAELPDPYKKPEPLDMHPDAIAARRYMENGK